MQQRNNVIISTYEISVFLSASNDATRATVLHVRQLRFSLVKPCFVALLRLFGEVMEGADDIDDFLHTFTKSVHAKISRASILISDALPFGGLGQI